MSLSSDIRKVRYGSPIVHQPIVYPVGKGAAGQTLWRGSVTALSGGTTVTAGYLKNMATPAATDLVVGVVEGYGPGSPADTAPGVVAPNTADGAVNAEIATGTFLFASGTGADALTVANVQKAVYLINENTFGATSAGSTRPVGGLLVAIPATDPTIPVGQCAVQIGTATAPWGGV
jgi:hypothetical protein